MSGENAEKHSLVSVCDGKNVSLQADSQRKVLFGYAKPVASSMSLSVNRGTVR